MFAKGEHGCPVADEVQMRTVAPAIGRPCALNTISSLREPCAWSVGAQISTQKKAIITTIEGAIKFRRSIGSARYAFSIRFKAFICSYLPCFFLAYFRR